LFALNLSQNLQPYTMPRLTSEFLWAVQRFLTPERLKSSCLRPLGGRVEKRNSDLTEKALDGLADLIDDIKGAKANGMTDEQLEGILELQRKASFYVDWVEAENSSGFHAPRICSHPGRIDRRRPSRPNTAT